MKKLAKKKKAIKLSEPTLSHEEQLKECFDVESEYFDKMISIISTSDENKTPLHKHHIVPRSYFSKKKWKVDNSRGNLACLTPYEHCFVHYFAWKCAKPLMKRSMAAAWHWMVNYATVGIKNIDAIALEYERAATEMRNTKIEVNLRLRKLKSSFVCIEEKDDGFLLKCRKCGEEKFIYRSWHVKDAVCGYCKFEDKRRLKGKYPLCFVIGWDKKAYKVTGDEVPSNSHGDIHSLENYKVRAKRGMEPFMERGTILKYSLVGVTDERLCVSDIIPKKPIYEKGFVEFWLNLYSFSKKLTAHFFPKNTYAAMSNCGKVYGLNVPEKQRGAEGNKCYLKEYFLEESHTRQEWEKILGYSWFIISHRYTVIDEDVISVFDDLIKLSKEHGVDEVCSKLKDMFESLEKYENDSNKYEREENQ